MDFESIKGWLTLQTRRQIRTCWLLAFLGLLLTPIALAAGMLLVYIIARVLTRDAHDAQTEALCFWIALGSMPVLFLINRFTPRSTEKEKFYHEDPDTSLVGSYMRRRKAESRFFLWILFTGPRCVDWTISSFRQIHRLQKQDTHSCAALLWLLMLKGKRVGYPDIQRELDWLDLGATAPQIGWLPGVLYINSAPPALSLTEDLRVAIRQGTAP